MAGASRIHWVAPVGMVGALFVGLLFALGHHLFYSSLAGHPAPTGTYKIIGTDISRQQLNTAVGTAFGFLVKSFLMITISIAFIQAFWRAARTAKKGTTLASLDSTYSLLSNLLVLFKADVWVHFPMPLLLAFIAWCVPIASIITPATLSVQSAAVAPPPSGMTKVPNFDFTTLDFVAPIPEGPGGFCFNGPSQPVQRVAAAVAAQGKILPISAPAANATWTLDFWAPSLQCHDVDGAAKTSIWNNILDQWGNVSDCSYAYGYLAWTPAPDNTLPFVPSAANDSTMVLQSAPMTYDAPASIYVATIPQMFNFAFFASTAATQEKCNFFGSDSLIYSYPIADDLCLPGLSPPTCYGQQAWLTDATLLKCDLMNSSYSADFNYVEGAQTINVTTKTEDSIPIIPHECFTSADSSSFQTQGVPCDGAGKCPFDITASRLLSYQGIAYAFNQLVLGSITMGGYGTPEIEADNPQAIPISTKTPGLILNSSIATTVLLDTEELAFVVDFNGVNETFTNLQMQVSQSSNTSFYGISNKMPTGRLGDLKTALEKLFQDITISLLAEDYLQPNYSSPYAPAEKTTVTFNRYHNVYIYSASTLWVAYGLAILFTSVALGLGVTSMVLNNASFTNDFSTILRTSRAAPMSEEVREVESEGRQPLPRRLAAARVMIGSFTTGPSQV